MNKIQFFSSILQAIPEFRGKRRIGRLLMRLSGVLNNKNITLKTRAGKLLLPALCESISMELFINGYYEKGLVSFLRSNIPENGCLVDVGANIGSISIPLARSRPDIRIIAVEASPWIYNVLKTNVSSNNVANVTPANFAVYDETGKRVEMYAPKDLFGKGSMKAVYTQEGEIVETITIDDIKEKFKLTAIHFIKVDVEGFEASVFKGMSQRTLADRPKIVFEFSERTEVAAGFKAREAQEVILSKGYQLQRMDKRFRLVGMPANNTCKEPNANLFAS